MATFDLSGKAARGPSHTGLVSFRVRRGKLIAQAWPKKRTQAQREKNKHNEAWFRDACKLIKYVDPEQQIIARALAKGSPLLPRDLLMSAMAGRLFAVIETPTRKLYSMAISSDVSEALDAIAQQPGSLLLRGDRSWFALLPGTTGNVLTAVDGPPHVAWSLPQGGGGGAEPVAVITTTQPITDTNVLVVPLPSPAERVAVEMTIPPHSGGAFLQVRLNEDEAANYNYRRMASIGTSSQQGTEASGATAFSFGYSQAYHVNRPQHVIFTLFKTPGQPLVFIQGDASAIPYSTTRVVGAWTNPSSQIIQSIVFRGLATGPLEPGTHIRITA